MTAPESAASHEYKLPRKIEADPRLEAVCAALEEDLRPLWEDGTLMVPHVKLTPALKTAILQANAFRQIEKGIESVDPFLEKELKGLAALAKKQGTPIAKRVSRILLITNDGAERFYRACESALTKHADRTLGLRLDVSSAELGKELFGIEKGAKALLVTDREATTGVLLALADLSGMRAAKE